MNTKIKIILIFLCLTLMVGCTTTGQAYLPRTSRVFHANKNCVGCYGSNPIVFQSVQVAANSGGIVPCNLCVKPQGSSSQGYTVHNYSAPTPTNYGTPSSSYSTTSPSYSTQSINNYNTTSSTSGINNRGIAENGSYYGEISKATGRPKTVPVRGYYRKDGTYVRGHYRSPPRKTQSTIAPFTPVEMFPVEVPRTQQFESTLKPYTPSVSPFKGNGLLDKRYTLPSSNGSGILGK